MCDKTDSLENNPFARLFPTLEDAAKYSREVARRSILKQDNENIFEGEPSTSNNNKLNCNENSEISEAGSCSKTRQKSKVLTKEERYNILVEQTFGFTLNKNTDKLLVWMEEFGDDSSSLLINSTNLEQILFERLLLHNPSENLVAAPKNGVNSHVIQTDVITYLVECLNKLYVNKEKCKDDIKSDIKGMEMLILRNVATALRQPQLYENQDLYSQFLQIFYKYEFKSHSNFIKLLIDGIVDELIKDEENGHKIVITTFKFIFALVHKKISNCNILNFEHIVIFSFLQAMASNSYTAKALLHHSTPGSRRLYSDTLIGSIISLSCLPKTNDGSYEFFDPPNIQESETIEKAIWTSLGFICDSLHELFLTFLRTSPEMKHQTLEWFADCLHANASKGKLGADDDQDTGMQNVSDGFMVNLSSILLRLCQPFLSHKVTPSLLKIDPTFCAAKITDKEEAKKRNSHMHDLHSETCLLPTEEGEDRIVSESFNFVTECFFLAQKSLDLGFRVCVEKINKVVEDLSKIQEAYNDAVAVRGANNEVTKYIQKGMHTLTTKYLSIRAALIEPKTLNLLIDLHATSANWLLQIILNPDNSLPILKSLKPVETPFPEEISSTLRCVPEFILLNLTCFLQFIKRYNSRAFEENGPAQWFPILSVIIIFMGSSKRISNPHLRAGLANALENLLPQDENDYSMKPNLLGTMCRDQLFKVHKLRNLIIPNLLNVFVSIEVTGQSVQFQEKFNYRRPMYVVMDFLWTQKEQRDCFKKLAKEAEENMEAVTPPLFLRFLNLLINDAVFLLDEALSNMAKLKTMQAARESGQWTRLPVQERHQNEILFLEAGLHAKFENILGQWTIHILELLTSEITSIFLHPVMVDRVAAMLNYFLEHLVGPKKKNFKVKDKEEYKFKPDVFVTNICKIYIHLHHSDSFCLAISRDGRSYNEDLFAQARDVLGKIRHQ